MIQLDFNLLIYIKKKLIEDNSLNQSQFKNNNGLRRGWEGYNSRIYAILPSFLKKY